MTAPPGNPFDDRDLVASYEGWDETAGRRADALEKELVDELLTDFLQAGTVLDVGCGTGHFSRWFETRGLDVVGVDLSVEMLVESRRLKGPPCVQGRAERLPFASKSADVVALITTLEFVGDAEHALAEACRVARTGIIVGALDRRSLLGRALRKRTDPPWTSASLYTPGELRRLVVRVAGTYEPRLRCRTTLWPGWRSSLPLPWGGYIGISALWN